MLYLPDNKYMDGLSTVWKEVIISITSGMAGIAALTAGYSNFFLILILFIRNILSLRGISRDMERIHYHY